MQSAPSSTTSRSSEASAAAGRRVAQVIASTTGGTGSHVRSLAGLLVAGGAEVTVCGPRETEERFQFEAGGARFVPIPVRSRPAPRDAAACRRIRAVTDGCDVVHAHGLRAAALAGLATPRRTPLVVTRHNALLGSGPERRLGELLERYASRRAAVTLCVSPDLVETVSRAGGRDVHRTWIAAPPLGPQRRTAAQIREELGAEERPLLLAVGRLDRQKDHPTLVESIALVADLDPRPLLAIAGAGPEWEALAALIDLRRVPALLLGDRADVRDLLGAADLLVSASIWEGCPLSVQEGLRAGLPFVGTAVGSVPDIVGDAGILVAPGDPGALAEALRRVLTDHELAASLRQRVPAKAAALPDEAEVVASTVVAYDLAIHAARR